MDDEGNIIVADSRNDRIQVVKIKALTKIQLCLTGVLFKWSISPQIWNKRLWTW